MASAQGQQQQDAPVMLRTFPGCCAPTSLPASVRVLPASHPPCSPNVRCSPPPCTPSALCFHPSCIPNPWCSFSLNSQCMDSILPLCSWRTELHSPSAPGTQESHTSTSQGHGAPTLVTFPFLLIPISNASGSIHRVCSSCSSHLSSASSSPLRSPTNHIHTPSSWTSFFVSFPPCSLLSPLSPAPFA